MDKKKQDCKYWDKCYQRNAEHREKYNHPALTVATEKSPNKVGKIDDNLSPKKPNKSPSTRSPREECDPMESSHKKFKKSTSPVASSGEESEEAGTSDSLQVPSSLPAKSPRRSKSRTPSESSKSPNRSSSPGAAGKIVAPERKEMDITKEYNEVIRNLSGNPKFEPDAVRFSQKAEYEELLKNPVQFIRHTFLVEMPTDFFKFWEFCEQQTKCGNKPQKALEKIGLMLVGPFDFVAGNFDKAKLKEPGEYLRHWRYYYDPAEFQTVFVKQNSEIHYGYWRDDPKDKDGLLMARNDSSKGCEFEFVGGNCFETVLYYLEKDAGLTPFNRPNAIAFRKSLEQFAKSNDISLESLKELKKKRDRKVVCKTFHGAGLVVPFDRKTQQGYRGLIDSDAKLKKILQRFDKAQGDQKVIAGAMEELQPYITAATIAVDECDFGTAIELGIDLFCSGHKELHNVINGLLVTGYSMVDRPQFIAIMKTHLESRMKGSNLSVLR